MLTNKTVEFLPQNSHIVSVCSRCTRSHDRDRRLSKAPDAVTAQMEQSLCRFNERDAATSQVFPAKKRHQKKSHALNLPSFWGSSIHPYGTLWLVLVQLLSDIRFRLRITGVFPYRSQSWGVHERLKPRSKRSQKYCTRTNGG